ncbi:hypothetical protein JW926_10800 [Candidatus Sumerlaeota bacterium]|nr:hypothetical protein [Candidatus Sumerlaeota bacterium]
MAPEKKKNKNANLGVRDMILLTIFAMISVMAKQFLRIPIRISGHGYFPYFLFLVFGSSYTGKKGAAAYMGLAAGICGVIAGVEDGPFTIFRFLLPGLAVELLGKLPNLFSPVVNRILEGIAAGWVMLIWKSAFNLLKGNPLESVLVKFVPGLITYTAMGALSGVIAHLLEKALKSYRR